MKVITQTFIFLIFFFTALQANAIEYFTTKTFTFSGDEKYSYLKDSVPSLLASRIFTSGSLENIENTNTNANDLYTILGSITTIGNTISIDISVVKENKKYLFPVTTTPNTLLQDIDKIAISIQEKLLSTNNTKTTITTEKNTPKGFAPRDISDWKESQNLSYLAKSFIIDDINNDGIAEIIILSETSLHIYYWKDEKLHEISKYTFYSRLNPVSVAVADVENSTGKEILVTTLEDGDTPYSYVFSLESTKLRVILDGVNALLGSYYDYTTKTYFPLLQYVRAYPNPFFETSLYSFFIKDKKIHTEKLLSFPKEANPFNTNVVKTKKSTKNILILPTERIAVYDSATKKAEYISKDRYSGTSNTLFLVPRKENTSDRISSPKDWYYMPMKIAFYEQNEDNLFLFISQPPELSATFSFSSSYRSFNRSNIISLSLENNELKKVWTSSEISASVEAVAVYDLNSDSMPELIVLINTYKGFLNFKKPTSKMLYFPLIQK